eukprot:scaffold22849_cov15-Tisochrysis_lutea.AAC.2
MSARFIRLNILDHAHTLGRLQQTRYEGCTCVHCTHTGPPMSEYSLDCFKRWEWAPVCECMSTGSTLAITYKKPPQLKPPSTNSSAFHHHLR